MSSSSTARAWLIFAMLAPLYSLSMFQRMAISIIAPEMAADLGVSVSDLAIMSSAAFISYGLMQMPAGLLTDAFGGKRTIICISLVGAAGSIAFALSPGLGWTVGARVLIGFGCAILVPSLKILAEVFPEATFARAYGLFIALGLTGTVFAGAPLGLLSSHFGWRTIMLGCGMFCVALAALLAFGAPMPKKEQGLRLGDQLREVWRGTGEVLRTRRFWPLCSWFCLTTGLQYAFTGLWWGPYLRYGCELTQAQAGIIISLAYFANLPGQPLMAIISDKIRSRRKVIIGCATMNILGMGTMAAFGPEMSFYGLMLAGICYGLSGCGGVVFASTRELFPLREVGTALGVIQTLPYLLMTPILQKAFGWVVDLGLAANPQGLNSAYNDAIWLFAACSALVFALAFLVRESFPQKPGTALN